MIVAARNDEMTKCIDLMVDAAGVEPLIERLTRLKTDQSRSHYHIEIAEFSPFGHETIFGEIILSWIGEPNEFGEEDNQVASIGYSKTLANRSFS